TGAVRWSIWLSSAAVAVADVVATSHASALNAAEPRDATAPTGPDPMVEPTTEASSGSATSAPRAARTGPVNWAPVRASSPLHTMAAVLIPVSATSAM